MTEVSHESYIHDMLGGKGAAKFFILHWLPGIEALKIVFFYILARLLHSSTRSSTTNSSG